VPVKYRGPRPRYCFACGPPGLAELADSVRMGRRTQGTPLPSARERSRVLRRKDSVSSAAFGRGMTKLHDRLPARTPHYKTGR
jgi:hypothetical protein